jgi:(2Fe-2S) ferredoxin
MTIETLDGESALYGKLDDEKARLAFREHALEGKVVTQLIIGKGREQITG